MNGSLNLLDDCKWKLIFCNEQQLDDSDELSQRATYEVETYIYADF